MPKTTVYEGLDQTHLARKHCSAAWQHARLQLQDCTSAASWPDPLQHLPVFALEVVGIWSLWSCCGCAALTACLAHAPATRDNQQAMAPCVGSKGCYGGVVAWMVGVKGQDPPVSKTSQVCRVGRCKPYLLVTSRQNRLLLHPSIEPQSCMSSHAYILQNQHAWSQWPRFQATPCPGCHNMYNMYMYCGGPVAIANVCRLGESLALNQALRALTYYKSPAGPWFHRPSQNLKTPVCCRMVQL